MMCASKALGKRYRETAKFNEAVVCHRQALGLAEQLGDTVEIIQICNQIGTNFRRMGIMDEASTYHYKALALCEQYHDKSSYAALKNRVISLNGIGNVQLSMENYNAAILAFRQALSGEQQLESDLGQAINYANIGAIFEKQGMIDSAWIYYRRSMQHNQAAGSNLGISLCHTYFGNLLEKDKQWDNAIREYRSAYDLMEKSQDRWHWIESCIALARVNMGKGDMTSAQKYLTRASRTAQEMQSREHLREVYWLNYLYYEKLGNCPKAFENYKLSREYADSVSNIENTVHLQNVRVNFEKEKSSRELALIQANYRMEQRTKNIILFAGISILLLTIIVIGFLLYVVRIKSRTQKIMRHMETVRSKFFTNITHEFRTPLTVILGLANQLSEKTGTDQESSASLQTIIRQGDHLLSLVNQLLNISKVRSSIEEPDWRTGDIVAFIRMIVENFQIFAQQKYLNLIFVPQQTFLQADFVPEYFQKVMHNLLSNALKYTPKGGHIYITATQENNNLVIQIADSGKGIDKQDLPHIFETFYQGNNSCMDMGTGVGLSLAKQMVETMGGQITVKSAVGKGTVFFVTLPLKHGTSQWEEWTPGEPDKNLTPSVTTHDPASSETEPSGADPVTILLVEDNQDVAFYIGGLLKDRYRLLYARDGKEGLEKAAEYMPDLILTDLMMPGMDGFELCREIRSSIVLNHIPIIIITAKSEDVDKVQGLEAGADAYLLKPFNSDELHVRIAKLLEQRRILREKYSRALRNNCPESVKLLPADQAFMDRLTDIVYSQLSDTALNSDKIAEKMCMSKSQLNRKVRVITGSNTTTYILHVRMEKAKRMLSSNDLPIGDIAMQCGFEDAGYFGRVFKQTFGMTPSQYRKKPHLD
ncbi:MAG TPA: response regulator [Candidatus Alistipes intestinigallinarum]|uniref:histidine kinase n=1 Tax=Candidatus Alistipes intestinigallinarum TaxID=2838440 RepID=A0A9D1YYV1_9BACT|nr:response regulator [Candidatus Alistipes intestinigallinarum]